VTIINPASLIRLAGLLMLFHALFSQPLPSSTPLMLLNCLVRRSSCAFRAPLPRFPSPLQRYALSQTTRTMAQEFKLKGITSLDLQNGDKQEVEVEGVENAKVRTSPTLLLSLSSHLHISGAVAESARQSSCYQHELHPLWSAFENGGAHPRGTTNVPLAWR